jgi:hypothetical protein
MLVGYARVSTQEQDLALQLGALVAAGRRYERAGAAALARPCPAPHGGVGPVAPGRRCRARSPWRCGAAAA